MSSGFKRSRSCPGRGPSRLTERFGPGKQVIVPPAKVDDALTFLEQEHPQPTNKWGMAPLWFTTRAPFRILDPQTGQPLPGQDPRRYGGAEYDFMVPLGTSSLRLMLDNSARLGLELCLPDADPELLGRVVGWLQEHLPCKLSPKQWRSWTPTRTGSFKSRRMRAPAGL